MTEKVEYEKRWCEYKFTADELHELASTLAKDTQRAAQVELEKKAVMSQYTDTLNKIKADLSANARRYDSGSEMRDIECIVERDFETGEIRYRRTDNNQVAARDKMTMGERQRRVEELLPSERPVKQERTDEEIRQEEETKRMMTSEKSSLN